MSSERFTPDRGYIDKKTMGRAPNGNLLCRWCHEDTGSKRHTFCPKKDCLHQHKMRSSGSYARKKVYARDKGFCARCSLDTTELRSKCLDVLHRSMSADMKRKQINEILSSEDFGELPSRRLSRKLLRSGWFWQADHIHSVRDGGGLCGLEGYQTLCRVCHAAKTKAENRVRSWKRKGLL